MCFVCSSTTSFSQVISSASSYLSARISASHQPSPTHDDHKSKIYITNFLARSSAIKKILLEKGGHSGTLKMKNDNETNLHLNLAHVNPPAVIHMQ
jgi:hypothetical protein